MISQRAVAALRQSEAYRVSAAAYDGSAVGFVEAAKHAILDVAESKQERERRSETHQRLLMEADDWGGYLRSYMEGFFQTATLEAILGSSGRQKPDLGSNPFRDIVHELAQLYLLEPKRTIDGKPAEAYQAICGRQRLQIFWQTVNVMLEACQDVLLWPAVQVVGKKKQIVHRFAAGDAYSVVTDADDPSLVLEVVLLLRPARPGTKRYAYWSDDWHGVFEVEEGKGASSLRQVAPGGFDNPLGEMPFVHVHSVLRPAGYWNASRGQDLVDVTLGVGEKRTVRRYSVKMSQCKQGVVTGDGVERITEQLRDEGALIRLQGDNINFQLVDWTIDLGQSVALEESEILHAAASRGINPERMKRTANYQSGAGADSADRGLIERRLRVTPILALAEAEYYDKVVLVAKRNMVRRAEELSRDSVLDVEYREQAYPVDPIKTLELNQAHVQLGTKSLSAIAMEADPKLSEADAKSSIRKNIKFNAEMAKIKMDHAVAGNLQNRSSTDEQNGRLGPAIRDGHAQPDATGTPNGDRSKSR